MSRPSDQNQGFTVSAPSEAAPKRPYTPPRLEVFKLSDVVRGASQGNFDSTTQGPGYPPPPPGGN